MFSLVISLSAAAVLPAVVSICIEVLHRSTLDAWSTWTRGRCLCRPKVAAIQYTLYKPNAIMVVQIWALVVECQFGRVRVQEVASHQTRVLGHSKFFSTLIVVGLTSSLVLDPDLNLLDIKSISICKLVLIFDIYFDNSLFPLLEDKEGEI